MLISRGLPALLSSKGYQQHLLTVFAEKKILRPSFIPGQTVPVDKLTPVGIEKNAG
jgi:hypothetical protein